MKTQEFNEIIGWVFDEIHQLSNSKGKEYAGEDDRLANFKQQAANLGLRPEQVWGVYASKHWSSVMTYIRDMGTGFNRDLSEPIEGRITDLILYLILLRCLVVEGRKK